ncbi:hypothetical protein ACFLY9_02295 [Patescibacteria group bacterium]
MKSITNFAKAPLVQFGNWKDTLSVDTNKVNLLGIDMEAGELKNLIQTAIIVGVSALVVGLVGVIGYGGFLWITAGDKEEQLQKAKKVMKGGFTAIVITFGFLVVLGVMAAMLGVNITDFSFLDEVLG